MKRMVFVCLLLAACGSTLKVEPVRVEPIHMTIDVNVHDDAAKSPGSKSTERPR